MIKNIYYKYFIYLSGLILFLIYVLFGKIVHLIVEFLKMFYLSKKAKQFLLNQ